MTQLDKIKFSHQYTKFGENYPPFEATLIQTFITNYDNLSKAFLDYDTTHTEGQYAVPKTSLILLIFHIPGGMCFTTLRRFTQQKWEYYKGMVGELFQVVKE